jgi:hypothetical protein
LEGLLEGIKNKRIEEFSAGELMNALLKKVNDNNILVASAAVECVYCFAVGLSSFSQDKTIVCLV